MKILAIETATEACSAALLIDNEITEKLSLIPRQHSQLILQMMDQLLAEAEIKLTDLDGFAFGCGPGSFTGVRIACGVAQGTCYGADLPSIAISSLRGLAQGIYRQYQVEKVASAFDARMGEVYWGTYYLDQNKIMVLKDKEQVIQPKHIELSQATSWVGAGSGWNTLDLQQMALKHKIKTHINEVCYAQDIAFLAKHAILAGEGSHSKEIKPVYLRQNIAKKAQNPLVF